MTTFKTQYSNPIQVTGFSIIEPTPVDDRILANTEDSIKLLFEEPISAEEQEYIDVLFDGLVIISSDSKKEYIWCESDVGLLSESYTYPEYATNIAGQDYAGKNYNFVLYDRTAKVFVTYDNSSDDGLFIEAGLLPYRVTKQLSTAEVTMKASTSGFLEMEHPDRVEFSTRGIMVILDPKPTIGEQFRITIS